MPKISELEFVDNLQDGCCFPMVSNGDTRRLSYGQLKERLKQDIGGGGVIPSVIDGKLIFTSGVHVVNETLKI